MKASWTLKNFCRRLCEIPGIGKWTAQYVAMRALGEPDAFPSSDLGLLRALSIESSRELEQRANPWRPWRAYAAMYLWRMSAGRKVSAARGAREDVRQKAQTLEMPMSAEHEA